MATVPAEVHGPSDAELITSVRNGDIDAYGPLYERHVTAAHNLARQLSRSTAEADDLVSEAFSRVLDTLRAGRGPDSAFRAYLLTSLRHVAYDKTRRDRRLELVEDVTEASGVDTERVSEPFRDTAVAGLERSMAARAFAKLPERWQAVLWHTEIEGQSPADVAPILGLTANGVSALAYRAREGLRQAYLQVHLAETTAERCRATVDKLGAWTRGGLSKRETAQVETHLDECARCRALAAELADVNGALRLIIAPLVLGAGTIGYLALAGKAAGTSALVGAGAGAGVGGAVAGAAGGKAAAGAAAALPRQFLGIAGAAAAVAAALAIALTGASTQQIPTAAATPPPPPAKVAPAPPAPKPNNPPAAPNNPPAKPAPQQPPAPTAPAPPPAPSKPGQPGLTASGPAQGVTLRPGGGPVDVPITASNTGTAPSGPVNATLNLPPGVSALAPGSAGPAQGGSGTGQGRSGTSNSGGRATPAADTWTLPRFQRLTPHAAGNQLPQVNCPGGSGTVSCAGPASLQPGQSVVLMFRLVAGQGVTDGETITGTVSAGSTVSVRISVRVQVPPPPPVTDKLGLRARLEPGWPLPIWLPPWLWPFHDYPTVRITVTNAGTSTKPVTVDLDRTGTPLDPDGRVECVGGDQSTDCHSTAAIAPGKSLELSIRLFGRHRDDPVTITATLGSASRQLTVSCPKPPAPKPNPPVPSPEPSPPVPQPPATTTSPSGSQQPGPPPQPIGTEPPGTTTPTPTTVPNPTPGPTDPPLPSCTNPGTGPNGHNRAGVGAIYCPLLNGLFGPM